MFSKLLAKMDAFCGFVLSRVFNKNVPFDGTAIKFRNWFDVTCLDSKGNVKWKNRCYNGVTTVGLNGILEVLFKATTPVKPASGGVCLGLIDSTSYSALAAGDQMNAHGGWLEATGYSNALRPTWGAGSGASGVITNASPAAFTINATQTIKGIFCVFSDATITNANGKGGTTGTLFATALFSGGDQAVVNGDTLNVTYTVTIS